ncbi:MAG: NUDIX domain-containing protein [Caldilineaceae bacterium]|nr:NUDIX domain-containing protein [Caldilineaceae bacterium]
MKVIVGFVLRLLYLVLRVKWRITRPLFVGVRMILIQEEQVLLVRHTYQQQWYFPGGAVKRGELMLEAAKREAYEEAGITFLAEPTLLGVYTSFAEGKSDHISTFYCTAFQVGERPDRWEIAECRFFPLDALPPDLSPACARRLADYQAGNGPYVGAW